MILATVVDFIAMNTHLQLIILRNEMLILAGRDCQFKFATKDVINILYIQHINILYIHYIYIENFDCLLTLIIFTSFLVTLDFFAARISILFTNMNKKYLLLVS